MLGKRKGKILLIDANPNYESKNEGKLIREFLKIIEVDALYRTARSKNHLLKLLSNCRCNYIHISSHGSKNEIITKRGTITPSDIFNIRRRRKVKLVVCSACQTGSSDLANAFTDSICRQYLAPKRDTFWVDTALFFISFYNALFFDRLTFKGALRRAFKKSYLRGDWRIYS